MKKLHLKHWLDFYIALVEHGITILNRTDMVLNFGLQVLT